MLYQNLERCLELVRQQWGQGGRGDDDVGVETLHSLLHLASVNLHCRQS